jgi:hypothetical protein
VFVNGLKGDGSVEVSQGGKFMGVGFAEMPGLGNANVGSSDCE